MYNINKKNVLRIQIYKQILIIPINPRKKILWLVRVVQSKNKQKRMRMVCSVLDQVGYTYFESSIYAMTIQQRVKLQSAPRPRPHQAECPEKKKILVEIWVHHAGCPSKVPPSSPSYNFPRRSSSGYVAIARIKVSLVTVSSFLFYSKTSHTK